MRTSKSFSNLAVVGEVRPETRSAARPWTGLLVGGHGRRRGGRRAQRLTPALTALALLAWGHPALACGPEYVGRNFAVPATGTDANGEGLRLAERSYGVEDGDPPLVIMREYDSAGPTASGATFCSAGTVNELKFYVSVM